MLSHCIWQALPLCKRFLRWYSTTRPSMALNLAKTLVILHLHLKLIIAAIHEIEDHPSSTVTYYYDYPRDPGR